MPKSAGSRRVRIYFIRPPRYRWPLMSESGGFWPPLAFATLAAAVRGEISSAEVRIVDCPGLQMGWRSLGRYLAAEPPDIVCIGDEAVCAHEGIRCARLTKQINPDVKVIAGGYFFPYMVEEVLENYPIDYIVRGEGEGTLVELLAAVLDGAGVDNVKGIAFRRDGTIVITAPRPLIEDLDLLPFPAYELLPMSRYGRGARSHYLLATAEHSRGCVDSCRFCILWRQMGYSVDGGAQPRPRYRSKSPERSFDEIKHLVKHHGRKTICWVDSTWNADPCWTDRFCELLLRSGLRVQFSAWMRADGIVRDERLGILQKLVRAGLVRVMIGIERPEQSLLRTLGKHNNDFPTCQRAFEILRQRYPQVLTIGTLIFGLWEETARSLAHLVEAGSIADIPVYLPLTPHPGTADWRRAKREGRLASRDFSEYDFVTPVLRTQRFSATSLRRFYWRAALWPSRARLRSWWHLLRDRRTRCKRGAIFRLAFRGIRIALKHLLLWVCGRQANNKSFGIRPNWYDN